MELSKAFSGKKCGPQRTIQGLTRQDMKLFLSQPGRGWKKEARGKTLGGKKAG